jgi:2-oxoglutarate ferredoxin oxidoreductase subunit alpha
MAMDAFDLAERFQQLVFVMSDLDLGMNMWMAHPFPYPEKAPDRGKVLDAASLKSLAGEWGRYRDVDGDGIPYRSIPGSGMPSYFTRGSGHNERGQYSERPTIYQRNVDRLAAKHETAKKYVARADRRGRRRPRSASSPYGTSLWAVVESPRRSSRPKPGVKTALHADSRLSVHRGSRSRSSRATRASTSSNRTGDAAAQMLAAERRCRPGA